MWEVLTWFGKTRSYHTELAAYLLLRRLQGQYIPCLLGVRITSDSAPLHPITNVDKGSYSNISQYHHGELQPGINVSEQEAERISSDVMTGLWTIEAEDLLHNSIDTRNAVLRGRDRSRRLRRHLELAMKIGERIRYT